MAWFRTGTITVTNGSTTVSGSGTTWIANAAVGEALYAPDGRLYEIANISSDTSLTLGSAYLGATASAQTYVIVPSQSYIRDLAAQAADLVNNYSTIANNAGVGKFGDGTLAAPGIRFSDDLDTGFFRSASNEVTFVAGGTAIFKYNLADGLSLTSGGALVGTTATQTLSNKTFTSITDSGNLTFTGTGNRILGDTTNATVTNRLALQDSTTNSQTIFSVFPNGTSTQSQVQLYNSSSGTNYTRFNLISFPTSVALTQTISGTGTYLPMAFFANASEAMRITTDSIVAIGTTTPLPAGYAKLEVNSDIYARPSTTAQSSQIKAAASNFASGPSFTNTGVKQFGSTATGTTAGISNTTLGLLEFVNTSTALIYTNGGAPIVLGTNSTERMRITSDGSVGIGTSSGNTKFTVQGAAAYGIARFTTSDYVDGVSGSGILINTGATTGNTFTSINAYQAGFASSNNLVLQNSGGSVGIGTSSPAFPLEVQSNSAALGIRLRGRSLDGISVLRFVSNDGATTYGQLDVRPSDFRINAVANVPMLFSTNDSERMRIDSSGNVGIGTSSPSGKLQINTQDGFIFNAASAISTMRFGSANSGEGTGELAFDRGAGAITFKSGNTGSALTERMRIDASGNVGINTTVAGTRFVVAQSGESNAGAATYPGQIQINQAAVSSLSTATSGLEFKTSIFGSGYGSKIVGFDDSSLVFARRANSAAWSESMRIDASGSLLVGGTTVRDAAKITNEFSTGNNGMAFYCVADLNAVDFITFKANAGTACGSISRVGTTAAVVYNTSSDYRLKDITGAVTGSEAKDFIMALQPKQGTWKADGSKFVGFLAHEFQAVSPTSVTGQKDAVDKDGKPVYQGMQAASSEVMANLIALVQQQQALIQDLTTRLTTLEGN